MSCFESETCPTGSCSEQLVLTLSAFAHLQACPEKNSASKPVLSKVSQTSLGPPAVLQCLHHAVHIPL